MSVCGLDGLCCHDCISNVCLDLRSRQGVCLCVQSTPQLCTVCVRVVLMVCLNACLYSCNTNL